MKKIKVCIAIALAALFAAVPIAAANMDLVVMVDTSSSMYPYYDELMQYLIQDLLTAKLHAGDSFHLLSFDSAPELELSLDMGSAEAARQAFGRLLLLQPLGRYTDLVAALQYLYHYTKELPDSNPKTILLVTDGVNDPPPNSPNRGSPEAVTSRIEEISGQIRGENWTVHILKVPAEPVPGEEGLRSYLPDISRVLDVPIVPYKTEDRSEVTGELLGFPTLEFPADLGRVGGRFSALFKVNNYGKEPIIVHLSGVQADATELLDRSVTITVAPGKSGTLVAPIRLPSSLEPGEHSLDVILVFDGDLRISPTSGTLAFTYTGARGGFSLVGLDLSWVLYGALALVVIAALVLLFLFLRRRLHEAPLAGVAKATAEPASRAIPLIQDERAPESARSVAARDAEAAPAHVRDSQPIRMRGRKRVPLMEVGTAAPWQASEERPRAPKPPTADSLRSSLPQPLLKSTGLPPMIEMRVSEQNSHIGFRNIHRIHKGSARTVGAGFSSFLIFLVPVRNAIASIRNDDGHYTFTPLRREYFPDLEGPVSDCIGVDIPAVSPKGYPFFIRFRQWISPLDEINQLMRSIQREE